MAQAYRDAAPFLNIGWFFVIAVLLGIWVGNYFDNLYSIRPLFSLIGAMTGILLGFLNLYKTIAFIKKKK